jgi:hypothetical protein
MGATTASGTGASRGPGFGAGRLFLADARLAFGAANYYRYRTLKRAFGVEREEANLLTGVLLLTAGPPAAAATWRVVRKPLALIGGTNAAIGAFGLREATGGIAGAGVREVPHFEALLALAIAGGVAIPQLRRATRGIRAAEHRVRERRKSMYTGARTAMRRE